MGKEVVTTDGRKTCTFRTISDEDSCQPENQPPTLLSGRDGRDWEQKTENQSRNKHERQKLNIGFPFPFLSLSTHLCHSFLPFLIHSFVILTDIFYFVTFPVGKQRDQDTDAGLESDGQRRARMEASLAGHRRGRPRGQIVRNGTLWKTLLDTTIPGKEWRCYGGHISAHWL